MTTKQISEITYIDEAENEIIIVIDKITIAFSLNEFIYLTKELEKGREKLIKEGIITIDESQDKNNSSTVYLVKNDDDFVN